MRQTGSETELRDERQHLGIHTLRFLHMAPQKNKRRKLNVAGSRYNPQNFQAQEFLKLRQKCLINKSLFVDDKFPADRRSIGTGLLPLKKVDKLVWKRPSELVDDPCLIVDGESRFDYSQGDLGNCWFLSAIGAITFQKDIMDQVVPADQSFTKDYTGIFHFQATLNGQLIFVNCKTSNEFWPALLEKAYANPPAYTVLPNGIVQGNAYTVTGVTKVKSQGKVVKLVRLLNPWGKGEWKGNWSDNSPLWDEVSSQDRETWLEDKNNGEFWMSMEDFCKSYDELDICTIGVDFLI
ncbi:hypothetical protein AMELA_G00071000 [Ameiurus melas]|uniref:Calpain catalytic domain-containing protein n=1 Tax=Ameiurus melas TaxID=219545 RepID=A0A7J6AZC5_AMEME|nr:hypothetical protein AMELA_G00071000 [Ameiurus melas]